MIMLMQANNELTKEPEITDPESVLLHDPGEGNGSGAPSGSNGSSGSGGSGKAFKAVYYLRVSGVLTLITMCVALLLALVNGVTKDVIARNEAEKTAAAVKELFPDAAELVYSPEELTPGVEIEYLSAFYAVKDGDILVGYYAEVSPIGFKGEVRMIVGLTPEGKVCGISILSHGETVGIGDKALDKSHLDEFIGFYGAEGVDDVSGATYTSAAVRDGVGVAAKAFEARAGSAPG